MHTANLAMVTVAQSSRRDALVIKHKRNAIAMISAVIYATAAQFFSIIHENIYAFFHFGMSSEILSW